MSADTPGPTGRKNVVRGWQFLPISLGLLLLGWLLLGPLVISRAQQATLTVKSLTWNLLAIDPANSIRPNLFPVGVRVCNQSTTAAPAVQAQISLANTPTITYAIQLTGTNKVELGDLKALGDLNGDDCQDAYFNVAVSVPSENVSNTRAYTVTASSQGVALGSISHVLTVSKDFHSTPSLVAGVVVRSPNLDMKVGDVETFTVRNSSIFSLQNPLALAEFENFVNFPNDRLKILSVQSVYESSPPGETDQLYYDSCGWDDLSPGCSITSTVPISGGVVTTYTVQALAPGNIHLSNFVYGYDQHFGLLLYDWGITDTLDLTISPAVITPTATATATPSPTLTATSTVTPTATSTLTPTPTRTLTPTVTGTPSPQVTNSVSPSQARPGSNFTFTIRITNPGASASSATLTDSFSSFLDIVSATTNKGTASTTTSSRTVTVNIGSLNTGDSVTIVIITRVNSSATTSTTQQNTATLTYTFNNVNRTVSSTASYQVLGSSTLPGTGGMELEVSPIDLPPPDSPPPTAPPEAPPPNGLVWLALILGIGLIGLGVAALFYSYQARIRRSEWAGWFTRTGVILLTAGLAFSLVGLGLRLGVNRASRLAAFIGSDSAPDSQPSARQDFQPGAPDPWGIYPTPTEPERLPDFPVPTPTLVPTTAPGEEPPDTSEITWMEIPEAGINNVVKYVPYDGQSWMIAGLREEIAWMGDTSWPGLGGNTGLAGHVTLRDGSQGPFAKVGDLRPGDRITLYTRKNIYTYKVREQRVVSSFDMDPVQPSTQPELTLITCTGWDKEMKLYLERLIIVADLVNVSPLKESVQSN